MHVWWNCDKLAKFWNEKNGLQWCDRYQQCVVIECSEELCVSMEILLKF